MLIGGTAVGGYLYVNSFFGSIHRISGITALTAAGRPVMPAATRSSVTILMMSSNLLPPHRHGHGDLGSSRHPQYMAGLISLVHINANRRAASVISIPSDAVVHVPRHRRMELWRTLAIGGPSLLITTVMRLTNVRIDHFAVIDFGDVESVVRAVHGVEVRVTTPFSNDGFQFHAGRDHLGPAKALAYARVETGISEIGREYLQQSLIRAFADKLAKLKALTLLRATRAVAAALRLDSNFSNFALMKLTIQLRHLHGRNTIWINAPTSNGSPVSGGTGPVYLKKRVCKQLWRAIRHDNVAAFARKHPGTLTPPAPF